MTGFFLSMSQTKWKTLIFSFAFSRLSTVVRGLFPYFRKVKIFKEFGGEVTGLKVFIFQ